jgi:hypothetical protein
VGTRDLGWFGLSFGAIQQLIVTIITRHLNMLSGLGRGVRVGVRPARAQPMAQPERQPRDTGSGTRTGANDNEQCDPPAVLMPCEFYRKTRTYRQVFGIMVAALNGDSRPCSQRNYWYHSLSLRPTISQIISGANPTTRSSHDPLVRANSRSHIGYSTETISPYNIAREPRFIAVHLMALKAYGLERDSRSPGRRVTQVSLDPRRRHTSWRPGTGRIYSHVATPWAATA